MNLRFGLLDCLLTEAEEFQLLRDDQNPYSRILDNLLYLLLIVFLQNNRKLKSTQFLHILNLID